MKKTVQKRFWLRSFLFENKSKKQTVAKNFFWLFISEGIGKGLPFLLMILIARYLGAEGYGKFSFAFSFAVIVAMIADFGFSTYSTREIARNHKLAKKFIGNIAVMKLFIGLFLFLFSVVIVQFLGKTSEVKYIVYLFALYAIINSFNEFIRAIYRAFEKMQYETLSKVSQTIILFVPATYFLLTKESLKLIVATYVVASIIGLIISATILHKNFSKIKANIDFKFWKRVLKNSWPFALSSIAVMLYFKIDTLLLSILRTNKEVGFYNAYYEVILAVSFLAILLVRVVFPKLSKSFTSSIKRFRKDFNTYRAFLLTTSLVMGCILFFGAEKIIWLLYGTEFLEELKMFKYFILLLPIIFLTGLYGPVLESMNKQRLVTITAGANLLLNIILNIIFIPKYGAYGSMATTIATELNGLIMMGYFIKKELKKDKK